MSEGLLNRSAERLYDALYEEEDARVCRDISDAACSNVPANFFRNASSAALGKLAEAITNTKTTIPWLLAAAGAPGWIATMLVPIRESGSMLPQLAIGQWVRGFAVRKWFYAGGAFVQALALVAVAVSVLVFDELVAGLAVLAAVVVFSLARGFCSVASKDVIGKTVPKTRRGRLGGLAASVAGFGTLLSVLLLSQLDASTSAYVGLVFAGAAFWAIAGVTFTRIDEAPGATDGGRNGLREALAAVSLLRDDAPFRDFVTARALLTGTALAAPLLVVLARERSDAALTWFLLAQGLASLLSGPLWGRLADRSSRRLLMFCGLAAGVLGLSIVSVDTFHTALTRSTWFLPSAFFVLAVVHDGVRLARKTYVLDLGGGNRRTDYVAVSNTVIGLLLLAIGSLTAALQSIGMMVALVFLSGMSFAALWFLRRLPEVQVEGK